MTTRNIVQIDVSAIKSRIGVKSVGGGSIVCSGGLIVEGSFSGHLHVTDGPLIVLPGASISGKIMCDDDVYVLGNIEPTADAKSQLICLKAVHLGSTCKVNADISAIELQTYVGAIVNGLTS